MFGKRMIPTGLQSTEMTRQLSEGLAGIFDAKLGLDTLEAAEERLIDAIAVTISGLTQPAALVATKAIDSSAGKCTVISSGRSAASGDAAFANAVCAHAALHEDLGGGGHPGVYVIPAALACAEVSACSGLQVLTAIVCGYEAVERVEFASPAGISERGFRAVPVFGPFGAAAAASTALGLDCASLSHSLNIASNMACGIYEPFRWGAMEGYFHAGFSAQSGVLAARLAEAGAVTTPKSLEGRNGFFMTYGGGEGDAAALAVNLDADLAITRVKTKPFPVCALNQDTILMIKSLAPQNVKIGEISGVILYRPAIGLNGYSAPGVANNPPCENSLQAQMSARFTAAAALLGKQVHLLSFFTENYADKEINHLANLIRIANSPDGEIRLEINFKNGETTLLEFSQLKDRRWHNHLVEEKFNACVAPICGNATATSILKEIRGLRHADSVGRLMKRLRNVQYLKKESVA